MKRQITYSIQVILLLAYCGCETNDVSFEKISFGECFTYFYLDNSKSIDYEKELIIQTEKEYTLFKAHCDSITPSLDKYKCEFPVINFNKYDLIGKCVKYQGCESDVTNTALVVEDLSKQYVFEIAVESDGNCESSSFLMNFYLVPKPPSNYSYAFNIVN